MVETIRVYIASGSAHDLGALMALFENATGFELAGVSTDSKGMIEALIRLEPDAILLDLDVFSGDVIAVVKKIMREAPAPIILISSAEKNKERAIEGISAGALTVIKKPIYVELKEDPHAGDLLLKATRTYSGIKVIRHVMGTDDNRPKRQASSLEQNGRIIAIASSTGGPQALRKVLSGLPATLPCGIVIAQHITQGFTGGLVDWLNKSCMVTVKEPSDGEIIEPGVAYISPDGFHISIERGGKIKIDDGPLIGNHRPSCNKLLKSVAKIYGDKAIGVILSGMGDDGAEGLKEIKKAGGRTIAQDEATSVVFGMPKVALEIKAVNRTVPVDRIFWEIMREFR
ncbi:MAG: chemotaxis protein CheB [Actinomycetota bacterium]